ncbi:Lsr2 family DNA-binding protein [Nocardioides rubriscoriae]
MATAPINYRDDQGKDYAAIRGWARSQGLEVTDRGRVPSALVEHYNAMH